MHPHFEQTVDLLCSPELATIVELVAWSPEPDVYEARAVDGHVRFRRESSDGTLSFSSRTIAGRDVLADQDPTRFAPLDAELSNQQPNRLTNSYPYAYEHLAQVFDHPCAPDLCVLHTAAHHFKHLGEHGSLSVVQARAPFIVSGAGIARNGMVEDHCRLVDVAPTILAALGLPTKAGVGPSGARLPATYLSRQDGIARIDVLDGSLRARRVVGFLMDGANANVLYDAVASGQAPNVGRLIERGTAFRYGAIASLPTVTLANHTVILTGCHPGHHGVLHNAWYDRALGRQVVTESPATWQTAMEWLFEDVETIHMAIKRALPAALTVSINEPADAGAGYSTFEYFRRGEAGRILPDLGGGPPPHTTEAFYSANRAYRFGTFADNMALEQARAIWSGSYLGVSYELPTFTWVNTSLTDAAFHEGGPHSSIARAAVRDTDARIGEVIAAVENAGVADETAFVLVADHGMEHSSADVTGDWGDVLREAGVEFRDESSGFLYLGVSA